MRRLVPLALIALLAGCGSGSNDDSSRQVLVDAASATTEAGSARMAFRGTTDAPGLPKAFDIRGQGVVDNAKRIGHLEFDFSSLVSSIPEGSGLNAADLKGEAVFDGFVFYMRFPVFQRLLAGQKEWVRFDLKEISASQGVDLGQITQLGQADPSQALQYLRAVSGEVEEKGSEDVRGVSTTRYEATVDLRKFPDVLPEDQRDAAKKSVDALIKQLGGDSELPMEVWIDDDGLIRRQRFDFAFEAPQGAGELSFRYDIELYDFGVAVDVEAPPEDKTADFSELVAQDATSG